MNEEEDEHGYRGGGLVFLGLPDSFVLLSVHMTVGHPGGETGAIKSSQAILPQALLPPSTSIFAIFQYDPQQLPPPSTSASAFTTLRYPLLLHQNPPFTTFHGGTPPPTSPVTTTPSP